MLRAESPSKNPSTRTMLSLTPKVVRPHLETDKRFALPAIYAREQRLMNLPQLRDWQQESVSRVTNSWSDPDHKVLVCAAPGAGKTICTLGAARFARQKLGANLIIVVVPTVSVKMQWCEAMEKAGLRVLDDVRNGDFREQMAFGEDPVENWDAICLTYATLSKDPELYIELASRRRSLLVADEVHHADQEMAFGCALEPLSSSVRYRIALSGTPFNSRGGALSMCGYEELTDEDGGRYRRVLPTHSFTYGQAIDEVNEDGSRTCRPVEFVKVTGTAEVTYKSLASNTVFNKVIDLSKKNDKLAPVLDPEGGFLRTMLDEGLTALEGMKSIRADAGMLVVTKDKQHCNAVRAKLEQMCVERGLRYNIVEVYNDTKGAHAKIRAMQDYKNDRTDIIVSVKMISEGVDIKRLRVGVYATNVKTEMFFSQFVGRFARWESAIEGPQHAKIVIPGHAEIIDFAKNIELLVEQVKIPDPTKPAPLAGDMPPTDAPVMMGVRTEAKGVGAMYRGQEIDDVSAHKLFFKLPIAEGFDFNNLDYCTAARMYRNWSKVHGPHPDEDQFRDEPTPKPKEDEPTPKQRRADLNKKIQGTVAAAVSTLKGLDSSLDDKAAFTYVNREINRRLGVPKKFKTETEDQLLARKNAAEGVRDELQEKADREMWT